MDREFLSELNDIRRRAGLTLKEDKWHGKDVVWSDGQYFIVVNDPSDTTHVSLWDEDNNRIGALYTTQKAVGLKGNWLFVGNIEIKKPHRGEGLGTKMYEALLNHMSPEYDGLIGYKPDISSRYVPQIYKKLGAKEYDDWYIVPNPNRQSLQEQMVEEAEEYNELPPEILQRLASEGFDVESGRELYHGTNEEFERFDRARSRTAAHIYTTPDPITASGYGRHVYLVAAKQEPQADLTEDYELLGRVADAISDRFEDDAREMPKTKEFLDGLITKVAAQLAKARGDDPTDGGTLEWYKDEVEIDIDEHPSYVEYEKLVKNIANDLASEFLQSGQVYNWDYRGLFQDHIMDLLFSWGYNSVVFYDTPGSQGGEPISIVFNNPADLIVVGKAMEGMR